MDVREQRTANLQALLHGRCGGVIAELARQIGKDVNQTRFILFPDKPGGRRIGEKLAREIESKMSLAPGALDRPIETLNHYAAPLSAAQLEVRETMMNYLARLPDEVAKSMTLLIKSTAIK